MYWMHNKPNWIRGTVHECDCVWACTPSCVKKLINTISEGTTNTPYKLYMNHEMEWNSDINLRQKQITANW